MPKRSPNDDVDRIIEGIEAGKRQALVILIVPSHTKHEQAITSQDQWADAALDLFADLFGGATAFSTYAGIYRDKVRNKDLRDKPILIESYAEIENVKDEQRLTQLVEFMKRMGKETEQAAVAVVIENWFYTITKY